MKYLKKINEMDRAEYKNQLGKSRGVRSSNNIRMNRHEEHRVKEKNEQIKKYNEKFREQWTKDFKDNLYHYMDLFLKYCVKEENFTDIITDDKLLDDFFNPHTSCRGLVVLGDDNEDEETTIEIFDIPDEWDKSFMGMYYGGETYYFNTIKKFNDKLEDILHKIFVNLLKKDESHGGCVEFKIRKYSYKRIDGEYTDYLDAKPNDGSIALHSTEDDEYYCYDDEIKNDSDVKVITNKEFCDAVDKWIGKYNDDLNKILNTIGSCKIYQSDSCGKDDECDFFITNAEGISSCYETNDHNGCLFINYIVDIEKYNNFYDSFWDFIGDPDNIEDYEVEDEQEKIEIVKDLIKFGNDVKNEANAE